MRGPSKGGGRVVDCTKIPTPAKESFGRNHFQNADLWNVIERPDCNQCYMCKLDLRHSVAEHEDIVAGGTGALAGQVANAVIPEKLTVADAPRVQVQKVDWKDKEAVRAYHRAKALVYAARNPERAVIAARKWRAENPERYAAQRAKTRELARAKKRQEGHIRNMTKAERREKHAEEVRAKYAALQEFSAIVSNI